MRRRAFLGLVEIAGYYEGLAEGLRAHGLDAVVCDLSGNPYEFSRGPRPPLVALAEAAAGRNARTPVASVRKPVVKAFAYVTRGLVFAWALTRFDVFVFGFGSSFFAQRELPLLRRLGKRIVHVFHGSDSRPPYLDGALVGGKSAAEVVALTEAVERRLRAIERHADLIVSNPLSSQLHRREFASFLAIGVPRRCDASASTTAARVRALHSPTDPEAKGTSAIRAAVDRLNARGVELDLVELTGRPNSEVLAALASCDFVVDQVYADVAMAGFASEAACFGKPALVGGYGRDALERSMCGEPFPPVHACHPDELEEALERLATDAEYRRRLGEQAHAFVTGRWSPREVAGRFLAALDGERRFLVDPATITYAEGGGLPLERLRALLRDVVAAGGREALRVSDKPLLEARLLALAEEA